MVQISPYPYCCGAKVLTGFNESTPEQTLREFQTKMTTILQGGNTKVTFILNQAQINRLGVVLEEASRIGFVLSGVWENRGHGSTLTEFQWTSRRFSTATRARDINYPLDRVLNERMFGDLNPTLPLPRREGRGIQVGHTVRINSPRSAYHGRVVVVTNVSGRRMDRDFTVSFVGHNGGTGTISINNVERIDQEAGAVGERVIIQGADERVVIHTSFHNVFRDDRVGPGWDTEVQAREAAPRAREIRRKDVYSTGEVVWEVI